MVVFVVLSLGAVISALAPEPEFRVGRILVVGNTDTPDRVYSIDESDWLLVGRERPPRFDRRKGGCAESARSSRIRGGGLAQRFKYSRTNSAASFSTSSFALRSDPETGFHSRSRK